MKQKVSIIIPTINETENIEELLDILLRNFPEAEIIVVDGGNTDNLDEIAGNRATIIHAERGRAKQMNAGAFAASGDILWFLHADCIPSPHSVELIIETCSEAQVLGGGFKWKLSGTKWYYDLITGAAHKKNKLKRNLFGDMGIFIKTDVFKKLNGYADIPLMEDVELSNRLRKLGKTILLDEPLISSDRRLIRNGPIKSFIKNNIIKCAYSLGFTPEYLSKIYK